MRIQPLFICLTAFSTLAMTNLSTQKTWRYVALGDSYTICEGAKREESWPYLLAKDLAANGISTELVANPSRTGWTTQNLIDRELPVFDQSNADFVTLCIGVNDWVQEVAPKTFEKNVVTILDHVQQKMADKSKIIVLTIPDFSVTPMGARYAFGRDASAGIKSFNAFLEKEARKRKLACVDLFEVSKKMKDDETLIAKDGLHPSTKEYALWETLILPVAKKLLGEK